MTAIGILRQISRPWIGLIVSVKQNKSTSTVSSLKTLSRKKFSSVLHKSYVSISLLFNKVGRNKQQAKLPRRTNSSTWSNMARKKFSKRKVEQSTKGMTLKRFSVTGRNERKSFKNDMLNSVSTIYRILLRNQHIIGWARISNRRNK